MNDTELIAALGWKPCDWRQYSQQLWWECTAHHIGGWANRPEVCSTIAERFRDVRAGIDLARNGIAEAIEAQRRDETGDSDPSDDFYECAAEIARGWGQ